MECALSFALLSFLAPALAIGATFCFLSAFSLVDPALRLAQALPLTGLALSVPHS